MGACNDGRDQSIPQSSIPISDGGNLNAAYIDMEAEDETVIEAEPAQLKRKLIATLQVSAGVMDMASFNSGPLGTFFSFPLQWRLDWAGEPDPTVFAESHPCWALKQLVRPQSPAEMRVLI